MRCILCRRPGVLACPRCEKPLCCNHGTARPAIGKIEGYEPGEFCIVPENLIVR
jgi:hypothetical protein